MKALEKIMVLEQAKTISELAQKIDVPKGTIDTWKSRGNVPMKQLRAWSIKYGKPLEWFTGEIDEQPDFATVKVYSRISCGAGVEPGGREEIGVVSVPAKYDRPYIIMVRARGRSMEPTIKDGGYVGIDTSERDVVSGEMYAVHSQIEGSVVKRLVVKDDCLELISDNAVFKPTVVRDVPDYFIIGRVRIVLNEF